MDNDLWEKAFDRLSMGEKRELHIRLPSKDKPALTICPFIQHMARNDPSYITMVDDRYANSTRLVGNGIEMSFYDPLVASAVRCFITQARLIQVAEKNYA